VLAGAAAGTERVFQPVLSGHLLPPGFVAEAELRELAGTKGQSHNASPRSTDHLDRLTPDQRTRVMERVQAFQDAWQIDHEHHVQSQW
jgi:hypothetical protein